RTGSKPLECPAKPTLNKSGTITICNGENVELTTSAILNSSWVVDGQETTNTDAKLLANKAGVYKRIAKNDNGCKIYSDEVTVKVNESPTKPTAVASSKTTFCEGESVQLNSSSSINNSWYRVGQSAVKGTLQGLTVDSTGSYFAKVTLSNGCFANSDTIKVTVNSKPSIPTITYSTKEICSGDSVKLTIQDYYGIQWFSNGVAIDGASAKNYTVYNAGLYYVKVSSKEGCNSSSTAIDIRVKASTEIPTIIPNGLPNICQGSSILLTSSVNASNVWYKNGTKVGTGQFLTVSDSGYYKVTAMRTNMCMSQSDSLKVTVNKSPSIPIITRNQAELVSNYTSGNQWYSSDGSAIPGASEQKFRPALSGYYTVRATVDGCTSAMSANYYYITTSVINISDDEYISFSPNPFSSNININFKIRTYSKFNIEIISSGSGKIIKSFKNVLNGQSIDLGTLSQGVYIFRVHSVNGSIDRNIRVVKL
ncbi:MAG: T9SS type A sorting domain-containing protein, partial [Bacteroidetes bacterium]|nr:T9SS type A sorting domain-containing protein [Bacteroidota bacterium]